MSGNGRKRGSKWDLKEESQNPLENVRENAWNGKANVSFRDRESHRGWHSPDTASGDHPKWSAIEPFSGRRSSRRDDKIDGACDRTLKAMPSWGEDESYGTRMSPGLDDWRQQNRHHSPKNEWKRSRRSRSLSRSRSRSRSRSMSMSRSRSRSPVPGYRRESGMYDRSRNRSGLPAQVCKDFAAGRCRRGNHCDFLHQDHEETWERHRKTAASKYSNPHDAREHPLGSLRPDDCCTDFLKGNCRRGASCRFSHHGASDTSGRWSTNGVVRDRDNDRRTRDASPERRVERETRRASDVPCKFFAAGNCRNGKHCRFSHHGETRKTPDRSRDDRLLHGQNSDDVKRVWNESKWSDVKSSSHATVLSEDKNETVGAPEPRLSEWSMDDKWAHNRDANKMGIDRKAVENDVKQSLEWKTDIPGGNLQAEQRSTENWLGDMEMSPEWNPRLQPLDHIHKRERASLPDFDPVVTQDTSGRLREAIAVIPQPSFTQQEYNLREAGALALPHDDKIVSGKTAAHMNISSSSLVAHGFNHNGLASNVLPLPRLDAIGQSQIATSTDPSRYRSIISPQNQTMLQDGKAFPDLGETNSSRLNSGIQISQSVVSSDHLTQFSNIQASLAHYLANGQQLPQLLSGHNSHNHADAKTVHPNQAVVPGKQYDPICDSIEPEKQTLRNSSLGLSSSFVGQDRVAEGKHDISFQNLPSSSTAGAQNGDDHNIVGSSTREPNDQGGQSYQLELGTESGKKNDATEVKESTNIQAEKKQDSGSPEKIDGDDKHDENKKGKDVKGIRAFKFALVEFVKEILKPTWKEGQMSKDAYKNIVKKVVDKVTGTMKGVNVPQTQERIEQYLSFAKPKLTKLTQAYVEKLQKDK